MITKFKKETFETERDVLNRLNLWSSRGHELTNFFIKIMVNPVNLSYIMFYDSRLDENPRKNVQF